MDSLKELWRLLIDFAEKTLCKYLCIGITKQSKYKNYEEI